MDSALSEVYRYLGRKGHDVSEGLDTTVRECMREIREASAPRHVYAEFQVAMTDDAVVVTGAGILLTGSGIRAFFAGCGRTAAFAATLGAGADRVIRKYELTDITRSLIMDACATQLIEEYCDEVEGTVRAAAEKEGLFTVGRFSPGYGGLPVEIQPGVIRALDAERRIGLTCTESFIMLPRKSVTAFIGITGNKERMSSFAECGEYGCEHCSMSGECRFKA